ncbi:hypothetical protein SAMN06298216_3332 [Spirosomataceae bacterium TFI 002]|nr:hypothetical protein SAMN06298216_3332 [Spirosomataceae bacterium TFI 002]
MKRIILLLGIITLCFFESNAQSFELTPTDGFLKSSSPDLFITGSSDPEIRGQRSSGSISSPAVVSNNSALLEMIGVGHNGSGFTSDRVKIRMATSQAWTSSANGTNIQFSTTANGTQSMIERMRLTDGGDLGIGTSAPIAKLEVANSSTGSTNPSMRLVHSSATGFNRILMSNLSRSSDWMLSSNVSSTDASSRWNIWYTGIGNVFTTTGDGNVGIGNSNPTSKLAINHSYSGTSSFDAHLDLKATSTFSGINFTDNSTSNKMTVLSYTKSATPSANYLLFNTQDGNAMIIRGDREVTHYSYTKLGQSAPGIQMKKLTGTTDSDSQTLIAHGLDWTKILDVSVFINNNLNNVKYPPQENTGSTLEYRMYVNSINIGLANVSSGLQGNSYEILITYEE